MSILKLIIKNAAPLPRLEDMNTVLFVGPHPDDIEIGAGATAAKLASMGKKVCFLICTDGRYGDAYTDARGDELAALISLAVELQFQYPRFHRWYWNYTIIVRREPSRQRPILTERAFSHPFGAISPPGMIAFLPTRVA